MTGGILNLSYPLVSLFQHVTIVQYNGFLELSMRHPFLNCLAEQFTTSEHDDVGQPILV